ncbi:MFS transporter [Clostridium sp. HV4-5-A1G]|jgi:hypothetical protein|uniref:MFS transporter n=1 Tax=Clostridium sp. HV4-5-A1G TaxID=2004595 RepID=UPI0012383DAE|nr:MFS transporter [Clostridium sp. HV4-5-A1G]KAA8670810.1 MFS transporter [Clostridium sp. HV4-5-A1G]
MDINLYQELVENSDLFGPKRTMGIAMIFWSFFAFAPAIAWGFAHFLSNTAGIVAPSITGYIVQGTGKFTSAFILAGSLALLSALVVLAFMHPIRKLDEKKISVSKSVFYKCNK